MKVHISRRKFVAQDIESIFLSYNKGKPMMKMKGKNIEKQRSNFCKTYA
jgi:hypothetical protein